MSVLDPTTTTTAGDPGDGAAGTPAHVIEVKGGRTPLWRKVFGTWRARIGGSALLLIILWAFLGPYLYHWNAVDSDGLAFGMPPSAAHWFGTNDIGQDIYAQTLVGLQKSLLIGLIAGPAATLIAGVVGAIAGYFGGVTDRLLVWVIDLLLVIPSFYALVLLSPVFKNLTWVALIVGLAVFSWMVMARVIRGQTMSLRERDYVKAARFMGVPAFTIIRRHILPNVASLLIIDATLGVGAAILAESLAELLRLRHPDPRRLARHPARRRQPVRRHPPVALRPARRDAGRDRALDQPARRRPARRHRPHLRSQP